ncbi:geranylgeranyl reductase family protein [Nocardioides sp. SYSU D00038]|uniref:geranylgeranyl reductase family protein n=1 Tax=Nocardioides sp. SYSU D00038 TaxID=2812554 RepID=UPI0019677AE6|nr:geranylgeranyl reductase family protein [Nocardioides sp. SYSU D00038]
MPRPAEDGTEVCTEDWDVVVVGAGPAGAATALGALHADPRLRVLLLDRSDFPRDKPCGDGIAPHVLDVLAEVGVTGLLDDHRAVRRLQLARGGLAVDREMTRPSYVVPRRVLDARLVDAARAAGAEVRRHRVRGLRRGRGPTVVDGRLGAEVLVGADGAGSVVRRSLGAGRPRHALALRGYAPTLPGHAGLQVIRFGTDRQPSYAWSFDRGDGLSNVGYGETLHRGRPAPSRPRLLEQLEELLPGASAGGTDWRGHLLPLSGPRWRPGAGRVLLVGDAAGLVNPMTGEGIYYAVLTGVAAGRAAARAIAEGDPRAAGGHYGRATAPALLPHLRHTAAAALLSRRPVVLDAGLRASQRDQRVFDDLVELGLARGRLTPAVLGGLARALVVRRPPDPARAAHPHPDHHHDRRS